MLSPSISHQPNHRLACLLPLTPPSYRRIPPDTSSTHLPFVSHTLFSTTQLKNPISDSYLVDDDPKPTSGRINTKDRLIEGCILGSSFPNSAKIKSQNQDLIIKIRPNQAVIE
ncbi:hypothetical protein L1887_11543 [Cichorium endivia]|nr:hypothetical protein L1887_11543 [Cichorium endivia]